MRFQGNTRMLRGTAGSVKPPNRSTVTNDNNLSPTIQTADCQGLTLPAGPSLFTGFRACVAFILPACFQAKLALNLTDGPAPP